jgi:16S rRNA (uracil1498-N3)-methyltransferase
MDRIIRQATEAGVAQIHPLISERTLGWENRADRLEGKTNRWKRIARSAVEQSGVRQPPIIESPRHLKDIQVDGSACNILFHPVPISNSSLHGLLELGPEKINLLLGPEGGFSEKELHRLLAIGYHPVYLGDSVLRVDTAALFAIAGVRLIILELEGWKKR